VDPTSFIVVDIVVVNVANIIVVNVVVVAPSNVWV
jgi:hypothetical protein